MQKLAILANFLIHEDGRGSQFMLDSKRRCSSRAKSKDARRPDEQDRGASRCARQFGPLRAPAWTTARQRRRAPLIDGIEIAALIGDKGFANDWLRKELDDRSASAVIPPKKDRKTNIPCDFAIYRWRHLIENFFAILRGLFHQAALART